jgi:hypothetical protein
MRRWIALDRGNVGFGSKRVGHDDRPPLGTIRPPAAVKAFGNFPRSTHIKGLRLPYDMTGTEPLSTVRMGNRTA